MKKISYITILLISIFIMEINVSAKTINVKLKKCIDGDTAMFEYKNNSFKARFLAIDTPETEYSPKGEQPFGSVASEYTCEKLKNAKIIKLEYDNNSDEKDKYDRHLVWVWLDDKLLQKDLVKKGYAKVTYLYDDYKYTDELKQEENKAKDKKIGIWSNTDTSNDIPNSNTDNEDNDSNLISIIIVVIFMLIITILNIFKHKKKI